MTKNAPKSAPEVAQCAQYAQCPDTPWENLFSLTLKLEDLEIREKGVSTVGLGALRALRTLRNPSPDTRQNPLLAVDTHQLEPALRLPSGLESDPYFLRARADIYRSVKVGMTPGETNELAFRLARLRMGLSPEPETSANAAVDVHPAGEVIADGWRGFYPADAYRPITSTDRTQDPATETL